MIEVTDDQFQELINQALEELPGEHVKNIDNVAILYEDMPTEQQIADAGLHQNQTLLGLYEGVPLTKRQGMTRTLPDKITLFKQPLQWHANTLEELKEEIKHTVWHEVAHYYGLDHDKIRDLE
jgi:predicted Zn-dependent protease with MMP-like domain